MNYEEAVTEMQQAVEEYGMLWQPREDSLFHWGCVMPEVAYTIGFDGMNDKYWGYYLTVLDYWSINDQGFESLELAVTACSQHYREEMWKD